MTVFRKFRSRLTAFVRVQAEAGRCSATPLREASAELREVRQFAARAKAVFEAGNTFGAEWLRRTAPPITYEDWQNRQRELTEFKAGLSARLATLRDETKQDWWDASEELCQELQTLLVLEYSLADERSKSPPKAEDASPESEIESICLRAF